MGKALGGGLALGAAPPARSLCPGNAPALASRDEVTALLDLAEDAVTLDGLAEPREQVLGGFAVS
jgi:hypothetical protein